MMESNNQNKRKKNLQRLQEAHAAMGCYIYMTFIIVVSVAFLCGGLFLAEHLFPRYVHVFNYSLSTRALVELSSAHKYKAAADFYEHKRAIFTTHGDKYENMMTVFDCYKRIGEYEKAEQILRDIIDLKYLTDKEVREIKKYPQMKSVLLFFAAKDYYDLYEEMGDLDGQRHCYSILKDCQKKAANIDLKGLIKKLDKKYKKQQHELEIEETASVIELIIRLYDCKMLYLESPDKAIEEMGAYINDIFDKLKDEPKYIAYIQKCLNLYINWTIESAGAFNAYTTISNTVEYTNRTDSYNDNKSEYGNLSDICYLVHDIKNSKKLYNKYTAFLKENTSEIDPLYIKNRIRGFKFLEDEQKWSELEVQVIECCTGLRSLIGKNIQTMSESQREHFVSLLGEPFDYAANLLYEHPSDALASLCFENSIFMKGLLLRSNRETANRIKNSGDERMLAQYDSLLVLRKELSYREGLGKVGNTIRINNLKKDINELDKILASESAAYRDEKTNSTANIKSICKAIKSGMAIIDFIETDSEKLLALLLTYDGVIKAVNLGSKSDLLNTFDLDYRQSYSDTDLTNSIWSPIDKYLRGVDEIYYTSNGIFNSISFQALSLGGHTHILDRYKLHLLSNISNILLADGPSEFSMSNRSKIVMWGDIDYGCKNETVVEPESSFRDIERGEKLHRLIYSREEIDYIEAIAKRYNIKPGIFDGANATELSFRSRSGKQDDILHISTHGFFEEDDAHRKDYDPMYNSGLFFAGADSTWNQIKTTFDSGSMNDDGILRAAEIQYLDLSGCHLAVLSACKTGLGHSRNKEGVYGLQRAFKLAGVDKVLMSLWNVDDKCTSELMREFYRYYYSGKTDEEALRLAQSAIREVYPSPVYWGAFVLLY